jgi:hypothetical protein
MCEYTLRKLRGINMQKKTSWLARYALLSVMAVGGLGFASTAKPLSRLKLRRTADTNAESVSVITVTQDKGGKVTQRVEAYRNGKKVSGAKAEAIRRQLEQKRGRQLMMKLESVGDFAQEADLVIPKALPPVGMSSGKVSIYTNPVTEKTPKAVSFVTILNSKNEGYWTNYVLKDGQSVWIKQEDRSQFLRNQKLHKMKSEGDNIPFYTNPRQDKPAGRVTYDKLQASTQQTDWMKKKLANEPKKVVWVKVQAMMPYYPEPNDHEAWSGLGDDVDSQSYVITKTHDKDGKVIERVEAYKNGKKVSDADVKQVLQQIKKEQIRQEQFFRRMQLQFNRDFSANFGFGGF